MYKSHFLGLNFLKFNQVSKELTINENIMLLDAFINPLVNSFIQDTPDNYQNGDLFILGKNGKDNDHYLLYYYESFYYLAPKEGMLVYLKNEKQFYFFDGEEWRIK